VSAELTQPAGTGASAPAPKRAGVVGASGILGGELLRILLGHPRIELEYVSAQTKAGRSATELNPHLKDAGVGEFEAFDARVAAKRCDVVFLATPPETAGRAVPELLEAGAELVVDLSPAYRIRDPELHRQWYPEVERDQEIAEAAAYGLPELSRGGAAIGREAIRDASVIAMPGCFATAILLAALPLRELEGVAFDSIAIDGKSGSTGSGARLRESGAHTWRSNVVAPYAPRGHRHVAEVGQALAAAGVDGSATTPPVASDEGLTPPGDAKPSSGGRAGIGGRADKGLMPPGDANPASGDGGPARRPLRLGMSTYGVDLVRGLSVGLYSFFEGELDERGLRRAYHRTYRDERFVRVQAGRGSALPLPDPKAVIGSNYCDVAGFVDDAAGRFVLIAAIDNMVKGGAGQAVQACNVRLGLPEEMGLEAIPVFPV
jgi:N-acetyl-gamma-glutamyl-phosphate reductase/N-acetyl-gamma-glutamyl-phosphate/LysW-gamma-L-alpha-aminoadipyl-6-phosphate reductase